MDNPVEAMSYLRTLIEKSDGYMEHVINEVLLEPLHTQDDFQRWIEEFKSAPVT